MPDYIKRESAESVFSNARKSLIAKRCDYTANEYLTRETMLLNAEQIIHALPAADVREVVRGKWEKVEYNRGQHILYRCSLCGNPFGCDKGKPKENGLKYCPNCGADMRGEADGN